MLKKIAHYAARYLTWYAVRCARERNDAANLRNPDVQFEFDESVARRIAGACYATVPDDVINGARYNASELSILTQRLGRRYDVAMALNEAANRALAAKKAAKEHYFELSGFQQQALAVQKQQQQRTVNAA